MKEHFIVQPKEAKRRLDVLLADKFTMYSRTQWQKIIADSAVMVNSERVTSPSHIVKEGNSISIDFIEPKRSIVNLDVLYEDENIVAIDKPANLLTTDETFLSREPTAEHTLKEMYDTVELVHRLDRETSGVLLAAKNDETKNHIQNQFRERRIQKHYIALVKGIPEHKEAILNWPIGRHPSHPIKWRVAKNGRKSITKYSIETTFNNKALLNVYPQTGRTHQIRVHLAYLGHPIISDKLYGSNCKELQRQFLHAKSINFELPDGMSKTVESELPKELTNYLITLE